METLFFFLWFCVGTITGLQAGRFVFRCKMQDPEKEWEFFVACLAIFIIFSLGYYSYSYNTGLL